MTRGRDYDPNDWGPGLNEPRVPASAALPYHVVVGALAVIQVVSLVILSGYLYLSHGSDVQSSVGAFINRWFLIAAMAYPACAVLGGVMSGLAHRSIGRDGFTQGMINGILLLFLPAWWLWKFAYRFWLAR